MTLDEPMIGAALATLARATALTATAPLLGDGGTPLRAKVIFVLAVTFAVTANRAGVTLADLPLVGGLELGVGALTGLTARFVMARAAVAGQLMGLSLGLGFASQYDIHAGESASSMRTLATTFAGLAFLAVGGLESIVRGIAAPIHVLDAAVLGPQLIEEGTSAMRHGLVLAAPIVFASLVGNVGIAVMNRAAPAINVFSVALAVVLLLGGMVLLGGGGNLVGGLVAQAQAATAILGH